MNTSSSGSTHLHIELLGPLRISINGKPVHDQAWDRRKTKSLLMLLLTAPGKLFSPAEIREALWPESEHEAIAGSLHAMISKLRRVLEPDLPRGRFSKYIRTERGGYRFASHPACTFDIEEVRSSLQQGREAQRLQKWEEAIAHYQRAFSRYRGDYLADEPDADWILPHREKWRRVQNTLLFSKSECYLSQGQYTAAIEMCQTLLQKDGCHEAAYRQLMLCHYVSGRLNEVVTLFRQCNDALKRELGIEPSQETVSLYQQILRRNVPGIDRVPRSPLTVKRVHRIPYSLGRLPFVGREHEVASIAASLKMASRQQGSIVLIEGEPGIGKTRLAEEVFVYARTLDFLTAIGRCYPPGLMRPYEPITEILRQILKGPGREDLLSLSPFWLSCAARILPEIPLPPNTPPLPSLPSDQEKQRLFEAIRQLLVGLSSRTPLVLLFDDLHWADDETIMFLQLLLRSIAQERVLILVTYRPEEASKPLLSSFMSSAQSISSRFLKLTSLSRQAIAELFKSMSPQKSPSSITNRLAARIHEVTLGNPFFLVETLQSLFERGALTLNRWRKWIPASTAEGVIESQKWEISNHIRQVVSSRLEQLPFHHRICLNLFSTSSRPLPVEVLARAVRSEGIEVMQVQTILEDLLRLGFVQPEVHSEGSHYFVHETIRQVIYEGLTANQKKDLHLRMAQVVEATSLSGTRVEELAYHFLLSEQWSKAFQFTMEAAVAAMGSYAYNQATLWLDRAEKIVNLYGRTFLTSPEVARRRLRILQIKEKVLGSQGYALKRQKIVAEMIRRARALKEPIALADAYLSLCDLYSSVGKPQRAIGLAKEAITLYERQGDQAGMAKAYRELGYLRWRSGKFKQAIEANRSALHLHEVTQNHEGIAGDFHNLAQIYRDWGMYGQGMKYAQKAQWQFQKLGERAQEAHTLDVLSGISRRLGNRTKALSYTVNALELYREAGNRFGELCALMDLASLWLVEGNHEKAFSFYKDVVEIARQKMGGHLLKEGHALRMMGILSAQQDQKDQAIAYLNASIARLLEAGDLKAVAEMRERVGDLLLDSGQHADAISALKAALEFYRNEGPSMAVRPLLHRLGQAWWACRNPKEAIAAFDEELGLARRERNIAAEGGALAALGVVYRETGDLKKSLRYTRRALVLALSLQDDQAEGYILSSLSDTYLAMGRHVEAEKAARAALKIRGDAWSVYRLGMVLHTGGKKSEGQALFHKARMLAEKTDDQDLLQQIASRKEGGHAEIYRGKNGWKINRKADRRGSKSG
jgi:DNA-binding SARP family transcriptional activator